MVSGTAITQDTYMNRVEELHRDAAETVDALFRLPIWEGTMDYFERTVEILDQDGKMLDAAHAHFWVTAS